MKRSWSGLLAILSIGLAGCTAVINPYVSPWSDPYQDTASAANAVKYAQDLRGEYGKALRDFAIFDRSIGVLMVGAGVAGAVLGINGGHEKTIGGLAAGGVGAYVLGDWLYSQQRLLVYSEGKRAIGCVLDMNSTLRSVDYSQLTRAESRMTTAYANLEMLLDLLPTGDSDINSNDRRLRGIAALTKADDASLRIGEVNAIGSRLYEDVRAVDDAVQAALIENEPSLAALSAVLGASPLARPAVEKGLAAPPTQPVGIKAKNDDPEIEALLDEIAGSAETLERAAARVELLLVGVREPSGERSKCVRRFEELGLAFGTYPETEVVSINVSGGAATGVVVARGGKPPYHARWIGTSPPSGVTLVPPNHDTGAKGEAEIVVKVLAGTPSGEFTLLVSDEGTGRSQVKIVVDAEKRAGTATQSPAAAAEPVADEAVRQVQRGLILLGCLAPKRADGDANDDGIWGERTDAAVALFDANALGGTLAGTVGKRGDAEFEKKLSDQLEMAATADPQVRCSPAAPNP